MTPKTDIKKNNWFFFGVWDNTRISQCDFLAFSERKEIAKMNSVFVFSISALIVRVHCKVM
jgi:hypothetical protein